MRDKLDSRFNASLTRPYFPEDKFFCVSYLEYIKKFDQNNNKKDLDTGI